jgi:hypothetical protein
MLKEFCTYEQALALKELGFDEPCFGYYVGLGDGKEEPFKLVQIQSEKEQFQWTDNVYHAPLYQQAFRWLRNQYATCWYIQSEYPAFYGLFIHNGTDYDHTVYDTYEEAEQACLDKLIGITKNK